jgi:hypothetical protein
VIRIPGEPLIFRAYSHYHLARFSPEQRLAILREVAAELQAMDAGRRSYGEAARVVPDPARAQPALPAPATQRRIGGSRS